MEKTNLFILATIILGLSLVLLLISSHSVIGQKHLDKNGIKKDNPPILRVSYTPRAVEGQLVILDASRSFDPDGGSIQFIWKKISPTNMNIRLSNPTSPVSSFVAPSVKSSVSVLFELAIMDDDGNTDNVQTHVIISKKPIVNKNKEQPVSREPHPIDSITKEVQPDKSRTKPPLLGPTIQSGPTSKARSDSKQGQSSNQFSKSLNLTDKKIRVNAGIDMEASSGSVVKLHGTIFSNLNPKEIKLSWIHKKGPYVQLSSSNVLDPIFIVPNVQRNEKIQFELQASDQNGVTNGDNINILIHPLSVKERNTGPNSNSPTTESSGTNSSSLTTLEPTAGITATAIDTTPPTVVSTTPANGATGVPVTTSITAKFSEAIKSSTITTSSFILKNNAGTGIPGTISYISTDGKTATFRSSSLLAPSTIYRVTISPSTAKLQDLAGNTMATKSWYFTTTADGTRPTVTSTTPASGAIGVLVTTSITAKFSEAIKSSTITTSSFILKNNAGTGIPGTISYISTDGKTATFKPSSSLAASTSFTVTLSPSATRLQDLAGNTMATKSWSFTTGATSRTGLYVPLFTYPTSSTWSTLISTKKSHPNLPILATINPSSGVGSSKDTNFVNGINQLKSVGITVIGYVYTDYGQRSSTVIKDEINKYKSWYGVNGIFFDEMSTTSGKETYYSSLNSYVKSSGMTFTMANPGTDTRSSYIGTVDNMIIYENQGLPSIDFLKGWHLNYNKKNFSIIPYGVSTLNTQFVNDAKNYVGYIYITNDVLPNPWNSLPSYFSNLAGALDQ
jgi:Spherulation-specific family 4/Bacterial Ig-like domain